MRPIGLAAARRRFVHAGSAHPEANCNLRQAGAKVIFVPHWFYTYFVHVLSGDGYQFWSGIGADIGELTLLTAFVIFIRQRNCHVHRCWRLAWHPHPVHGHPVCRKHHPHHLLIHPETAHIDVGGPEPVESST